MPTLIPQKQTRAKRAATFVVHPTKGEGDYQTIAAAIAALPAAGGTIFVREGTYSIAAEITLPNKPVRIVGSGRARYSGTLGTVIDIGSNAISAFGFTNVQDYHIENLSIKGNDVSGQSAFRFTQSAHLWLKNVDIGGAGRIENLVNTVSVYAPHVYAEGCNFYPRTGGTGYVFKGRGFAWFNRFSMDDYAILMYDSLYPSPSANDLNIYAYNSSFKLSGSGTSYTNFGHFFDCTLAGPIGGPATTLRVRDAVFDNCYVSNYISVYIYGGKPKLIGTYFGCTGATAVHLAPGEGGYSGPEDAVVIGCHFRSANAGGLPLKVEIHRARIVGCSFSGAGSPHTDYCIDVLPAGTDVTVQGCSFIYYTVAAIRTASTGGTFAGNMGCKVVETGSANNNRFSENLGFGGSTIIGAACIVENKNTRVVNTTPFTPDETHRTLLVDASGGSRTIALPTAASMKHRSFTIKKIDSSANAVVIDGNGAETIDGAATVSLTVQYQSLTIQSDGTEWWIT